MFSNISISNQDSVRACCTVRANAIKRAKSEVSIGDSVLISHDTGFNNISKTVKQSLIAAMVFKNSSLFKLNLNHYSFNLAKILNQCILKETHETISCEEQFFLDHILQIFALLLLTCLSLYNF